MNLNFKRVERKEIDTLADLANTIWHEYFPCIISEEQINYMVDKFQSKHAMIDQIDNAGYEYFFIYNEDQKSGYFAVRQDGDRLFLSKLYLLKENRGKGLAGKALDFIMTLCRDYGKKAVWLTVNRNNEHTINVYKHKGFEVIDTKAADIGEGFVMDDYIMEAKV